MKEKRLGKISDELKFLFTYPNNILYKISKIDTMASMTQYVTFS